jgi:hypothetical protein
MKTFAALFILVLAGAAAAQTSAGPNSTTDPTKKNDMKDCPMHAQHMASAAQAASELDTMNQRGNDGMGFDQAKTTHHFLIAEDGGSINVSAKSANDADSVAAIRGHFQHIARAFAAGDFAIPMFVHDQTPPGVVTMQKLKAEIQYRYEQTPNGARIVISSKLPQAVAAIHDFLDFQIREHRTGDPLSRTE